MLIISRSKPSAFVQAISQRSDAAWHADLGCLTPSRALSLILQQGSAPAGAEVCAENQE
jgi:hypothetical protein